ncbi:hydrogenase maturation protease [Methylocystis parvus]|uniref:hydrogenase maturation protease n=1 Tax=Methylocystis parvus TaxID=134 RepID=UPI003C733E96
MATIVIGVGNHDRGDDAAGRKVAHRLRAMTPPEALVVELDGEATTLLARLEGASAAILIDACVSGAEPGTLHRFDVATAPLPSGAFGLSSHGFGLSEAIELARALGTLPKRCVVYAIEGERFDIGAPMSDKVMAAIVRAAQEIRAELATL